MIAALMELESRVEVGAEGVPLAGDASVLPDLVRRARQGDGAAWDEIWRRFAKSVHAILLARLDPSLAEDTTQEVFLSAHRRLAQLREAGSLGPWLHAMARNAATDRLRARGRAPRREPLREDLVGKEDDRTELRERVLHHIQSLPDAYKETLLLRLVEGLTGPEIAEITGLTPASVRVNLHRGMELLRPLLMREGWP